jgi:hypothetical protein
MVRLDKDLVQVLLVVQVALVAVAVDQEVKQVAGVQVEQDLYNSSIKMYAVVSDNVVLGPLVATLDELDLVQKQYPDYNFIEMTEENTPAIVGEKWIK